MNYRKNMKIHFFIAILSVSACSADAQDDEPKPKFPFMGFIYYPQELNEPNNETNNEGMFMNAAVLVGEDLLLSGNIDMEAGFPKKTLMARVGATRIDANFTIGADEQEREIIAIIRPKEENPQEYWKTDITLLKTALPFENTSFVAPTKIPTNRDFTDKTCSVLIYAQRDEKGDDRDLIQMDVELLTPTIKNCGKYYNEHTMTCGTEDDNVTKTISQSFCQDNTGGPLICDKELMGLQTYPDNENHCKSPYIYQIISAWNNFINCGMKDCADECTKVCSIQYTRNATDSFPMAKDIETSRVVEMIDYDNTESMGDITILMESTEATELTEADPQSSEAEEAQSSNTTIEMSSNPPESSEMEGRQDVRSGNDTTTAAFTTSALPKRKSLRKLKSNKVAKTGVLSYLLLGSVLDLTFVILF